MEVLYNDSTHTYYTVVDGRVRVYTSATTLINKYKQPFDSETRARLYAQKHGRTPEYWLKTWAKTSKDAKEYGTSMHNTKEKMLYQTSGARNISERRLIDYGALQDGVYTELKLWNHEWGIAGRADKCIITTKEDGRYMDIDDYKTNKVLTVRGYEFRDGSRKRLLPPITHLEDSKLMAYTLQLSLYQYMAESLGFKPGNRSIIHIPNGMKENVLNVPYLRKEVEMILTHAKEKKYIGN